MKKLLFPVIIMFSVLALNSQETFFPTKEGTVMVYKTYDKKDKLSSEVKYTIEHVTVNGSNTDITYLCESFDSKEKPIFKDEITIHQKGDVLYLDMSNFVNKAAFQQNGEIPADIQITGNNMEMPSNPQPGQMLPDASVEMSMKMGFVNMKVSADVTNRKVEGVEEVSVAAGSFSCYKLSSDIYSVALGIKVNSKNVEWYAKGVGIVKTETYNKKGELIGHTELAELK